MVKNMFDAIYDFPACLNNIMKEHRWSAQYLASALEYSSKTSIVRILHGESSYSHQQSFYKKLCASNLLSQEDAAAFAQALEVSRVGLEKATARQILHNFIYNPNSLSAFLPEVLKNFLAELNAAQSAKLLAVNCVFPSLFSGLRPIIAEHDVFEFQHYFSLGPSEIDAASALSCVSQMAYLPNYEAHSLREDCQGRLIFRSNMFCASILSSAGESFDYLIHFSAVDCPNILKAPSGDGLFAFYSRMLEKEKDNCEGITASCQIGDGPMAFIDVLKYWLDCENNRNMYEIKPDLCANMIATEYLRASLLEGGIMSVFGEYPEEAISQMLDVFLGYQSMRFDNMFRSKRAKHILMSQNALKKFSQTGLITEHFAFMRPFTVKERIQILEHLLDQHKNNGYFTIYLWKETDSDPVMEVDCWDDLGVTAFPSVKDSAMQKSYCNSIILHSRLVSVFKDYFMDDLRRNHVLSNVKSAQFLEDLILKLKKIHETQQYAKE